MLSKAVDIEEIIAAIKLYIGFLNGKIKLAGGIQTPIMSETDGKGLLRMHYVIGKKYQQLVKN